MASLYELAAGYATLIDAYDNAETPEERENIMKMLESAEGDIADKAEAYAKIIRMKEEEANAFKAEGERLIRKKQVAENVVKRLKAALLDAMKLTGQTEIDTSIGRWKTQLNPMSCDVTDPDKVPERFHVKQPDKIDKAAMIREHKATGEIFDGAKFTQEFGIRFR